MTQREPGTTFPGRDGSLVYAFAGLLGILIAIVTLRLWHADLRLPLYYAYGGDGFAQAAIAKNFTEGGSINWFPNLAAPIGGILYDFPTLSFLHLSIERLLLVITGNSNIALNLLFLISFPLTTLTAFYVLRRLGASIMWALPIAGLYAALPARYDRNEGHLFYATYWLLPLAVYVCVLLARGDASFFSNVRGRWLPSRAGWFALVVAVLIGTDNQYHAFFTIGFLAVAAAIGTLRIRSWSPLLATAIPDACNRHDDVCSIGSSLRVRRAAW